MKPDAPITVGRVLDALLTLHTLWAMAYRKAVEAEIAREALCLHLQTDGASMWPAYSAAKDQFALANEQLRRSSVLRDSLHRLLGCMRADPEAEITEDAKRNLAQVEATYDPDANRQTP